MLRSNDTMEYVLGANDNHLNHRVNDRVLTMTQHPNSLHYDILTLPSLKVACCANVAKQND